jgi:rhamnulokinase
VKSPQPIYCAAVDLGATSGRVILGTWDGTTLSTTEVHRFPNALRSLGSHDYWDIAGLWHEVRLGLIKAAASLPAGESLASVGVDTWGVDHVLLNDAGRLVYPVHAYRDNRTQAGLKALKRQRAEHTRIYAATGVPAVFYNTSLQLAETVTSSPAITKIATHCLFLPDYFNYLLCGDITNEISIASTSQLLDVAGSGWSAAALEYFGIPARWFKTPINASTPLGLVSSIPELKKTRVVAVPGHDTACAYEALPSSAEDDDLFISSGTWSLVGCKNPTPLVSPAALKARISNERTGDGGFRPVTNLIGLWLLEGTLNAFSSRPSTNRQWQLLISAASDLPAPRQLLDVDDPAFANPPSMKAAIDAQLTRLGVRPPRELAAYVRLICDSLGQGHARVLDTFTRLSGRTFKRILLVGGGAKNSLLCQATADAAGIPVVALQVEGSALGNLGSQLIALQVFESFSEFRARVIQPLKTRLYRPRTS